MEYYVEYYPIDIQNSMVEYYNKNVMPVKIELEKAKAEMNSKLKAIL